jgi:hypothetical protein
LDDTINAQALLFLPALVLAQKAGLRAARQSLSANVACHFSADICRAERNQDRAAMLLPEATIPNERTA